MTRSPGAAGRMAFIGAGPGDPGLVTVRAHQLLGRADLVITDPDVPAGITALATAGEVQPAVGGPAEVAELLIAAVGEGRSVVRLIAGDVLTADAVVEELGVVAATDVPFEVVPGLSAATAAAGYAGIPVGAVHTVADVRAADDWQRLAAAPGTLLLQASAHHLADAAAALAESGVDSATPVSVTAAATLPGQRTVDGTLATLDTVGRELPGPLVVTIGSSAGRRGPLSWWESRALYGWRVLIPQTKDSSAEMVELLLGHGATSEKVPTIAVEPPRTPAQMERAVKGMVDGRYQWVLFTSENSVRAVWEKFTEFGLDARAFSGMRIACVDERTAAAVRALGIVPDLVPEQDGSGAGTALLLDEFPEHDELLDPVDRVLLPRADIATETLAAGLRELGWEVDDVTAYRTVRAAPPPAPVREAIKTGGFDAVCFTSSSTVRNLVGIAGKPHARTIVACLGPKTAETAREFGLRVDVQAETPEIPVLVAALAAHAARLRAEGALPPPKKSPRRR